MLFHMQSINDMQWNEMLSKKITHSLCKILILLFIEFDRTVTVIVYILTTVYNRPRVTQIIIKHD